MDLVCSPPNIVLKGLSPGSRYDLFEDLISSEVKILIEREARRKASVEHLMSTGPRVANGT